VGKCNKQRGGILEAGTTIKAATNQHFHTEKFSGDTHLKEYLPEKILMKAPATGREGGEGA